MVLVGIPKNQKRNKHYHHHLVFLTFLGGLEVLAAGVPLLARFLLLLLRFGVLVLILFGIPGDDGMKSNIYIILKLPHVGQGH